MSRQAVTTFLGRWQRGEVSGGDAEHILPVIYDELRAIARRQLRAERGDHTLQPTALVHEAYLRLVDQEQVEWQGRGHFLAVAATAMRRLLVDHARGKQRLKRGGDAPRVALTESLPVAARDTGAELVAVDDLLETLATVDERAARVVECRYFAGLSIEETARALELSPMTVKRSWQVARAWLRKELAGREGA
ncbi:sigma-70 family RNA polymerase sigma factor [bacterium]|nr:sigma-70 family RNA polymerase sigma factor [bacterium]